MYFTAFSVDTRLPTTLSLFDNNLIISGQRKGFNCFSIASVEAARRQELTSSNHQSSSMVDLTDSGPQTGRFMTSGLYSGSIST